MKSPPLKTCQWYESPENPECGLVAATTVTVKTKITTAKVNLCDRHKKVHDDNFARARAGRSSK